MAHAYHHARSSTRRFGGIPDDYLLFHMFMDHTKEHLANGRHRLFLHNAQGIFLVERVFGLTFLRVSDGKRMALRPVLEQHVIEDFGGFLPSLPECFKLSSKQLLLWQEQNLYIHQTSLEEVDQKLREEIGEQEFATLSPEFLQRLRSRVMTKNPEMFLLLPDALPRFHKALAESQYSIDMTYQVDNPPRLTFPDLYIKID